jgi:hypothetical protein
MAPFVRTPFLLALAGLLIAVACAPVVIERPQGVAAADIMVVVVGGPRERPLDALAPATARALRSAGYAGRYAPDVVDRISEYRDLSASRAIPTSAELARIAGADVALYVAVERLERVVDVAPFGDRRRVAVTLQVRVTLVDPATGTALWSVRDAPRSAVRTESTAIPLPTEASDPLALALRDRALVALAPEIVARLERVTTTR